MRRAAGVAAAALALAAPGCGSDEEPEPVAPAAPTTAPRATAPEATAPPTDATGPTTTAVPPASTTSPESGAGAGDEEPVRVPARFEFTSGGVEPRTVSVPAFLAVTLTIVAGDGRAHTIDLDARGPKRIAVAAGARATLDLAGLRPGRYRLRERGRTVATLVAGGEPGP